MQNLRVGTNYIGVCNAGPCKGTLVYVKYLGKSNEVYGADCGKFLVLSDTEFGVDDEDEDDDGWWYTGEILNVHYFAYNWSEDVGVTENE